MYVMNSHNKEHGRFEGKKECEFDADGNMVKRR